MLPENIQKDLNFLKELYSMSKTPNVQKNILLLEAKLSRFKRNALYMAEKGSKTAAYPIYLSYAEEIESVIKKEEIILEYL